jgi:bacterioferritin (cytochrome b1)
MTRLIKQSQNFININPSIVSLVQEILHLELTSSIRYKFYEITTTGAFHDAIVPNFKQISEADAHHAWELAMLLSSYGVKTTLPPLEVAFYNTTKEFFIAMIDAKKKLIEKYTHLRDILNTRQHGYFDPGAVTVIEEIMSEERMNMSEIIKLLDQSSLLGL